MQGLDLSIEKGEMMAIIGNSGSGKSTLLNMLGGLDRPSVGKLFVDGKDILKFSDRQLIKYRMETVGFVWQNNARNLIPYLTALENIELPLIISGKPNVRARALEFLEMVGLSGKRNSKLSQLSSGEQQRIAISIGAVNYPKILLADEPTGSVDNKTSNMVFDIFRELNKSLGITIIIVTHDKSISNKVDRVVAIRDGMTSSEFIRTKSYTEEMAELDNPLNSKAHVEFAVLDKTARIQIPKEYLETLGLVSRNKIRVELEGKRIILFNHNDIKQ